MAKTKYELDINKQAIIKPVVILRQGDHDIDTMHVSLSVANEPMDLTGATVTFMGNTANGRQIIDDVHVKIIDAKGGVFEYVFPSEASSDIGEYKVAYFSIILANGQSSTMDFRVQVLSGVDISAPVASEYISHYDTMVTELNSAYDSATHETNQKMASTVSSLATSAATVLDSALARVNDIDSTANNASSAASNAVSMASSVASAVTSQASYINSVASSAASNVSSVAATVVNKLNNISVGGRNLLLGTADWSGGSSRWDQRGTVTTDTYRGTVIASTDKAWTSPVYLMQNAGILQVGKTYTFSTYVRNTSDTDTKVAYYYDGGIATQHAYSIAMPAHTDWTRLVVTFKVVKDPATSTSGLRWEGQNTLTNGQIQFAGYKLEEGNVATDWTPAPEDVPMGLTVGGRNLLLDTRRSFTGVGDNSTNGNFNAQGGLYYLAGGKTVADLYNQYGPSGYLTISFDWIASGSTITGGFVPLWASNPWAGFGDYGAIKPSTTNKSGHYKATVQLNSNGYSTGNAVAIKFRQDNLQGNITISNLKLEAGNISTGWTPAPEDADSAYVNKSGDTMTGGLKGGVITLPEGGDLNDLTETGKYYQNLSVNAAKWNHRPSNAPNAAFGVDVIGSLSQSTISQVFYTYDSSRMWVRGLWKNGSVYTGSEWAELADDSNVVHKTGNETIAGDKTFTGNTTFTGDFTPKTFTNTGTGNGITWTAHRTGNFVFLTLQGTTAALTSAGAFMSGFRVSEGMRPVNTATNGIRVGSISSAVGALRSDGTITFNTDIGANIMIVGSFTYSIS